MSYTKLTDFAVKDTLLTGNPAKIIRGTEIDAEFDAIESNDAQNIKPSSIDAATSKVTPVDADLIPLVDSAASGILKKLTWANLKATLKTWIEGTSFSTFSVSGNATLGDSSTDTVTVNGYIGVGGAADPNRVVSVQGTPANNGSTQRGVHSAITGGSGAATAVVGFSSIPTTAASGTTTANLMGFQALNPTKGAGSTITNQHGLYIDDQTQGTNNYGITSLVSSGTNKWNIYASGTAANYFAGNVGIGTNAPAAPLEVRGTTPLRLSRDLLIGAGNGFGSTEFAGRYDATNYGVGARIQAIGDGTWSGTSYPTYLSFQTAASGSTTPTERMRIDSNGTLVLAQGQIKFPATEVLSTDANTLDSYEEGTFTPTIVGATTAGVGTYTTQVGRYTKVGNRVFFHLTLAWSAHTGTGNMYVAGLPFTSNTTANAKPAVSILAENLTYTNSLVAIVPNNTTAVNIYTQSSAAALTGLAMDAAATLYIAGHYEV